jgi:hydroxymethylpyrimidine pyrophosphatase-like HAD family hydrolase
MRNANVFVDVDLTLVDANGKLLAEAREALQRLRDKGCHLFLWSLSALITAGRLRSDTS